MNKLNAKCYVELMNIIVSVLLTMCAFSFNTFTFFINGKIHSFYKKIRYAKIVNNLAACIHHWLII